MSDSITGFFSSFTVKSIIKSSDHNTNYEALRGNRIPIHSTTQTSSDLVHSLGNASHRWTDVYAQPVRAIEVATGALSPTTTTGMIFANASTASFAITLLTATSAEARRPLYIYKQGTDFNQIDISDGNGTLTSINTPGESVTMLNDGSNWLVTDRNIPSEWTSFTPTGGWTGNLTYTGQWRRVRDSIDIMYSVKIGGTTITGTTLDLDMVSGFTIDTAKLPTTLALETRLGGVTGLRAATSVHTGSLLLNNSTSFQTYMAEATGSKQISQSNPFTIGAADVFSAQAVSVPIVGWKG